MFLFLLSFKFKSFRIIIALQLLKTFKSNAPESQNVGLAFFSRRSIITSFGSAHPRPGPENFRRTIFFPKHFGVVRLVGHLLKNFLVRNFFRNRISVKSSRIKWSEKKYRDQVKGRCCQSKVWSFFYLPCGCEWRLRLDDPGSNPAGCQTLFFLK